MRAAKPMSSRRQCRRWVGYGHRPGTMGRTPVVRPTAKPNTFLLREDRGLRGALFTQEREGGRRQTDEPQAQQ